MGRVLKQKTWIQREKIASNDLNKNFDALYQELNGNLDDSNVKEGAAIKEAKIAFSPIGHNHDGENSAEIPRGGVVWSIPGQLFTGSTQLYAPLLQIDRKRKLNRCRLIANTPPTGSNIEVDILISTDSGATYTSLWNVNTGNRPKINANSRTGLASVFDIQEVAAEAVLKVMITKIGSSNPGSDLTIELF